MPQKAGRKKAAIPGPPDADVLAFVEGLGLSPQSNLIGVLQQVQDRFGHLPPLVLKEIGRRMRIPLSRVWGVVSFYAQFYTEPRGRHTVRCCRGTACHVRGGKKLIQAVRNILGLDDGETSEDMMFSFETVMVVDGAYYGKATPQRIERILNQIIARESAREDRG
jgi:NADH-quinone oxidoreductase subunit E